MELNLSGQTTLRNQIAPALAQLRNAMAARKEIWDKLPNSKKKQWVKSGKDPIMTLAWDAYKALDGYFDTPEVKSDL